MTEQPTDHTPQGENTPASEKHTPRTNIPPRKTMPPQGENTPQGENSPPSEVCPPISEITPPLPEHTPPLPISPPTISGELRADLCKAWVLGFLDAMKGAEVNGDDEIMSDMAESLETLAAGCIDHSASVIAQVFAENPQAVYQTVYGVGFEACSTMNLKAAAQLNRN